MKDKLKYNNFNVQTFYDNFEVEYSKVCNEYYRLNNIPKIPLKYRIRAWISECKNRYFKSDAFLFLVVTIITSVILSLFYKNSIIYKYIWISCIPLLIFVLIIDYSSTFSLIEKKLANTAIDNLLHKENFSFTEESLKSIINSTQYVGTHWIRLRYRFKDSVFFKYLAGLYFAVLAIFIGYISSTITGVNIDQFLSNFSILLHYAFLLSLYVFLFYLLIYFSWKSLNRKFDLFLEVLKDKEITLLLQKEDHKEEGVGDETTKA